MSLDEFIAHREKRLQDFRNFWLENSLKDPQKFIPNNDLGDWYDEYHEYIEDLD